MSKKIKTFSVFLVVAVIFWFLNALDKEYVTEISYPIAFHNLPYDKVLSAEYEQKVTVKVRGYGFDIVGRLHGNPAPISIDMTKSATKISEAEDRYYIRTAQLKDALSTAVPDAFTVLSVQPDTIFLDLKRLNTHKVPVRLPSKPNFAKSFMRSGKISIVPESVYVYYNTEKTIAISEIFTSEIPTNINKTETYELNLTELKTGYLKQKTVKVTVPAEQYSEKVIELTVQIINSPADIRMIIFPKKVKLKLKLPLSLYPKISEKNFTATVDYKTLNTESSDHVRATISYIPISDFEFLPEELRPFPEKLDYIIEKK